MGNEELLKENKKSVAINEWNNFIEISKSPWIIISFLLSGVFTIGAIYLPENHLVRAILTLLVAIFSGIVGALFLSRWEKLTETQHLILKGRMAIENLLHLLSNMDYLERRGIANIHQIMEKEDNDPIYIHIMVDIIDWLRLLQEECMGCIENWVHITQDMIIMKQIDNIKKLRAEKREFFLLKKQLEMSEEEGNREILKDEINKKEKSLSFIEKEIAISPIGGLDFATLGTSGTSEYYAPRQIKCSICGKIYEESRINIFSRKPICFNCQVKTALGG